jgi:hypothetical protein
MTQPTCELCSRPLPDTAYVCSTCATKVGEDLERIVDYAPEVENAVLKLVRYGASGQGSGERPVPFDDKRAERAAAVGNTVATWARHVSESRGVQIPRLPDKPVVLGPLCYHGGALSYLLDADRRRPCLHDSCEEIRPPRPALGAAVAARWLVGQLEWLRHQPEAAEAFTELRNAARELQRVVDRPRDLWYAGPCRNDLPDGGVCEVDIYAVPGTRTVRCRECKAEYDAVARRDWLLQEARDQLLHAEWIARALTALGIEDLTGSRIRNLAARGRIEQKGTNAAGDPVYKVGEVLDVLEEQAQIEEGKRRRREAKAAKRAEKAAVEADAA